MPDISWPRNLARSPISSRLCRHVSALVCFTHTQGCALWNLEGRFIRYLRPIAWEAARGCGFLMTRAFYDETPLLDKPPFP